MTTPVATLCCAFLVCCVFAATAAAQDTAKPAAPGSSVALWPGADPTVYDASIAATLSAALHQQGYQVLVPARANQELERLAPAASCAPPAHCDYNAMLHVLAVDALVIYALRMQDGHATELSVRVVRKNSQGYAAQPALGQQVKPLVQRVLVQALADADRPATVHVKIASEPAGALISVDGDAPAAAPRALDLSPGRHELTTRLSGYAAKVEQLDVRGEGDPGEVVVRLSPVAASAGEAAASTGNASDPAQQAGAAAPPASTDPDPKAHARASAWNFVLGGVLAAGAVALAANAVSAGLREGDCTGARDLQGRCSERIETGTVFWSSVALGVASAAGATLMFAVQPIHTSTDAALSGLRVQWRRSF